MKHLTSFVLSVALGLVSFGTAQTPRTDLFDLKRSQQELEVMRGILSTTLSFVIKELRSPEAGSKFEDEVWRLSWRGSSISAFYLYGQGAVFVVPGSSFRTIGGKVAAPFGGFGFAEEPDAVEHAFELLAGVPGGVGVGVGGGVAGGVVGGVVGGVPGGVTVHAVQAAARAAQTATRKGDEVEMRKKLADAQEKVKKQREESEAKRAKFLEQIGQVKGYLVEALANHGDSLTHVKPNEYLNIIISTDDTDFYAPGLVSATRTRREILSVQKSVITDYKAGKLSLEAFKQKVLQYAN